MNTIKATKQTYWINGNNYGVLEIGNVLATKEKPFTTTNKEEWLSELGVSSEKELKEKEAYELEAKILSNQIQHLKTKLLSKVKSEVSKRLSATDYKVIRHVGQKALSNKNKIAQTKLSESEYEDLELERENLRDWSNEKEAEINSKTTIEELEKIEL